MLRNKSKDSCNNIINTIFNDLKEEIQIHIPKNYDNIKYCFKKLIPFEITNKINLLNSN